MLEPVSRGEIFTTSVWYWRLGRAVAKQGSGALSRAFATLDDERRALARRALSELPPEIGMIPPRRLRHRERQEQPIAFVGPVTARCRRDLLSSRSRRRVPEQFSDDPPANLANVRAFNEWVADDWGFAYKDRIFAPANVAWADPALGVVGLERVIAQGARTVLLPPGPIHSRAPGDPVYDGFWARSKRREFVP